MRISEELFRRRAQPGDILLFAGKTLMNKCQRLFTWSRFDHIAMILRNLKGGIEVVDAAAGDVSI
ncbi:MAG: hypothetical protein P4M11_13810 [Candidatus Pacebacteria bacterium]|nr:hypothetical protein [Candidatus Paceibacterota bacterium]